MKTRSKLFLALAVVTSSWAPVTELSAAEDKARRDYGTPTAAPDKVCPFTGDLPVDIPTGSLPLGSSLPGAGGVVLPGPSLPSTVHAELCMTKAVLAEAQTGRVPAVLVLVHGITYGTWYWDLPYQPERYSAVNALIAHGYATLNLDRIGDGRSGHPPSALVTSATNGDVVHQAVSRLRAGDIGGIAFRYVGLVGHSYGTVTNWREAAVYDDVDINIGTGYSDGVNPITAGLFVSQVEPASQSPYYAGESWTADPGYLQPLPGSRDMPQLYHLPNADPEVIALDERLANTVTSFELMSFAHSEQDGSRKNLRSPTFLINGEYDIMVCGNDAQECATEATTTDDPPTLEAASTRLRDWQASSMSAQACFRAAVIPEASHDINLHRNATQLFAQIIYFADQAMGPHGENLESYREGCAREALTDLLPGFNPNRNIPPTSPPP